MVASIGETKEFWLSRGYGTDFAELRARQSELIERMLVQPDAAVPMRTDEFVALTGYRGDFGTNQKVQQEEAQAARLLDHARRTGDRAALASLVNFSSSFQSVVCQLRADAIVDSARAALGNA
jgi:hypothetical protein